MEKSEVNKGAFVDYSDFVQKNGRILAKRKAGFHSNEVLEMMIEEYVLMIQSEVRHLDYLDTAFMSSTRQIAIYMAELAECITRRYFKGRHMELSDSVLELLKMIDLIMRQWLVVISLEKMVFISLVELFLRIIFLGRMEFLLMPVVGAF